MARQPTLQQAASQIELTHREGVAHVRTSWDGKTLLLGVGFEAKDNGVSTTRMYRIEPDGSVRGV